METKDDKEALDRAYNTVAKIEGMTPEEARETYVVELRSGGRFFYDDKASSFGGRILSIN